MDHIALSKELEIIAKELNKRIESVCGEPVGFTLLIYTDIRTNYISNIDRQEAIEQMRTLLNLWENGMPDIPAHEFS